MCEGVAVRGVSIVFNWEVSMCWRGICYCIGEGVLTSGVGCEKCQHAGVVLL